MNSRKAAIVHAVKDRRASADAAERLKESVAQADATAWMGQMIEEMTARIVAHISERVAKCAPSRAEALERERP